MTRDRGRLRSILGTSASLWAGSVAVTDGDWRALSGARSVEYNVVMCHGVDTVAAGRAALLDAGQPGLLMVSGQASGEVQDLVDAGWVCAGAVPFMERTLSPDDPVGVDRDVYRRLKDSEYDQARTLVTEVFELGPGLDQVAFGDIGLARPGVSAWGAFDPSSKELVSCLGAVEVEGSVCIWSMATAARARRQGHGARLLDAALADGCRSGARRSLLHSSHAGEPFYSALGYVELERWQLWSRPRWLFGRA